MKPAQLLEDLAQLEREADLQHDPRWDRLTRGQISPESAGGLLSVAGQTAWGQALTEAYVPLDAAACARIAQTTIDFLAAHPVPSCAPASAPAPSVNDSPAASGNRAPAASGNRAPAASGNRVPAPSANRALTYLIAAVAAIAAALSIAIVDAASPESDLDGASGPLAALDPPGGAVPRYQLEASGGDVPHANRASLAPSGSRSATLLGKGASLALVLRPGAAASPTIAVLSCKVRDGRAAPWPAPWERSELGSFRVEGTRESLFATEPAGELTLAFAVGEPAVLPSCESLALAATEPDPEHPRFDILVHHIAIP